VPQIYDVVFAAPLACYTANRLQRQFPKLNYYKFGAPGASGGIEPKGVHHMNIPGWMADNG
jgi:hypothetical protein